MDGYTEIEPTPVSEEEAPGVGCPFCLIAEGKLDAKIVYSDGTFLGILDINPANPGHVLLFPKFHYTSLGDMNDDLASRMFVVAKRLSNVLLETLHAKGFNMFLANGQIAGQKVPHVLLHLIPRFDQDGLVFTWKPKTLSESDMKNVADAIKSFSIKEEEIKPPTVFYELGEDERIG